MDLSLGFGLIIINDWLLLLFSLIIIGYVYLTWNFDFWRERGIPGPKPYPLFGTAAGMFKRGFWETEREDCRKYGKVFGTFLGRKPILLVSDEEMLRDILVKEFSSFTNREASTSQMNDEVSENFLTTLKDEDWKRIRNAITPAFTSGKMKIMFKRIQVSALLLVDNISESFKKGEEFEAKELSSKYTMDVIGSTAFGLELNSQKDNDNEFVKMAKKIFTVRLFSPMMVLFFLPFLIPLFRKMKVSLMPKDTKKFFLDVIENTLDSRKSGGASQQDFMQLMANAHREEYDTVEISKEASEQGGAAFDSSRSDLKKGLSKDEILAQGFIFFLAGFETTATTISLLLYNLACYPECQERLHTEIEDVLGDKDMEYSSLSEMPYLDQCFNESMRLYPPAPRFDRVASRDVTIKGVNIPKGTIVAAAVFGIHQDPQIYPDPEKFDPERFTSEAKAARSPYHYLPFGYGPRNCLGMRLAIMEAKVAVIEIIRRYRIVTTEKTQIPLKFKKLGFLLAEKGIWLKAEKRTT